MTTKHKVKLNKLFEPLIPALISELSDGLVTIKHSLEKGDLETVERLAHGYKGAAGNYQLNALARLFLNLEKSYKEGDFAKIPEHISLISDYIQNVEFEFHEDP